MFYRPLTFLTDWFIRPIKKEEIPPPFPYEKAISSFANGGVSDFSLTRIGARIP